MLRPVIFALILGLSGCAPAPINMGQARASLKAAAEQVRVAFLHEDHGRLADLMHPELLKSMGGREKCVAWLTAEAADLKGKGFKFSEVVLSEPSEIAEGKESIYAIVPQTIKMSGPFGAKGTTESALIAVSRDRGVTWRFVDSTGFAGDRSKVGGILRDFPDQVALPPAAKTKWTRWPFN
jgi:hypothetical protein